MIVENWPADTIWECTATRIIDERSPDVMVSLGYATNRSEPWLAPARSIPLGVPDNRTLVSVRSRPGTRSSHCDAKATTVAVATMKSNKRLRAIEPWQCLA